MATITFAAGLGSLIGPFADDQTTYGANYPLSVERYGPLSDDTVSAALSADPDITASIGIQDMTMTFERSSRLASTAKRPRTGSRRRSSSGGTGLAGRSSPACYRSIASVLARMDSNSTTSP